MTFTVQATVRGDWAGGDVTNTASVTPGTNTECAPDTDPSCSATTTFPTPSLITITKTHEPTHPEPQPGQDVTYRVTVTNLSDQQAANATIDEPLPPQLDRSTATWTTTTTGTGTTATPASGTGPPTGVAVTLAPEGTVTFTITAEILTTFPGGSITNTASATPGDNTACHNGDPVCDASTAFNSDPPPAALAISKTADSGTEALAPGDTVTYNVTVTNTSTTTGHGTVTDRHPGRTAPRLLDRDRHTRIHRHPDIGNRGHHRRTGHRRPRRKGHLHGYRADRSNIRRNLRHRQRRHPRPRPEHQLRPNRPHPGLRRQLGHPRDHAGVTGTCFHTSDCNPSACSCTSDCNPRTGRHRSHPVATAAGRVGPTSLRRHSPLRHQETSPPTLNLVKDNRDIANRRHNELGGRLRSSSPRP